MLAALVQLELLYFSYRRTGAKNLTLQEGTMFKDLSLHIGLNPAQNTDIHIYCMGEQYYSTVEGDFDKGLQENQFPQR